MSDQDAVLKQQLQMNRQSWQALQEAGVGEDSQLRLDFFYAAADQESANALVAFIQGETDYEVRAEAVRAGFRKKDWAVAGSTQPAAVSLPILDQWVEWMVTAGFENGCVFDGWGAQAPG